MAKKADKTVKGKPKEVDANAPGKPVKGTPALSQPWIQMKTGIYVVTAASILMAVLTTWQSLEGGLPWLDSILYGLLFGALVWVIFYFSQLFFRWLRQ